jgi:hypothetical protein
MTYQYSLVKGHLTRRDERECVVIIGKCLNETTVVLCVYTYHLTSLLFNIPLLHEAAEIIIFANLSIFVILSKMPFFDINIQFTVVRKNKNIKTRRVKNGAITSTITCLYNTCLQFVFHLMRLSYYKAQHDLWHVSLCQYKHLRLFLCTHSTYKLNTNLWNILPPRKSCLLRMCRH